MDTKSANAAKTKTPTTVAQDTAPVAQDSPAHNAPLASEVQVKDEGYGDRMTDAKREVAELMQKMRGGVSATQVQSQSHAETVKNQRQDAATQTEDEIGGKGSTSR